MKLLVLADKYVGLEVVKYLVEHFRNDISLLVTSTSNEIFHFAEKSKVRVSVWSDSCLEQIRKENFDLGILAWWPSIIRNPLISLPQRGFINFHPSFLPFNRGKHYNFWAIVEEAPFGVTLHRVTEGIDAGDIVNQKLIQYDWTDTGESLFKKAQVEMVDLFQQTYPKIRGSDLDTICIPQDLSKGSFHYASEIEPASQLHLNKEYRAKELLNLLRARTFPGHPGCWFIDEDGHEYEVQIQIKRK